MTVLSILILFLKDFVYEEIMIFSNRWTCNKKKGSLKI